MYLQFFLAVHNTNGNSVLPWPSVHHARQKLCSSCLYTSRKTKATKEAVGNDSRWNVWKFQGWYPGHFSRLINLFIAYKSALEIPSQPRNSVTHIITWVFMENKFDILNHYFIWHIVLVTISFIANETRLSLFLNHRNLVQNVVMSKSWFQKMKFRHRGFASCNKICAIVRTLIYAEFIG